MSLVKLSIVVCSNRDWVTPFASSLMGMVLYLRENPIAEEQAVSLKLKNQCSLLPAAFDTAFEECLQDGATHLLLLADDMVFPRDTVHQLYRHQKRCVAINMRLKRVTEETYASADLDGNHLTSKDKTGIEEVSSMSPAIMLLDVDVLRKCPQPRFEVLWNAESKRYVGEDRYFCNKIRECGEKIFVDHDLSHKCGHMGRIIYTTDGVLING